MTTPAQVTTRLAGGNFTEIEDPGTGNAIRPDRNPCTVPITIVAAAAETNTLAAPVSPDQVLTLFAAVVGASGSRTITVASPIDEAGRTTIVLDAVDEYAILRSVPVGAGVYEWRLVSAAGFAVNSNERVVISHVALLNADIIDQLFFLADRAYKVKHISWVQATAASDAGTVFIQVKKASGTTAIASGQALLTNNTNSGFDVEATANTVQVGTLTATAADLLLAAGDRLGLDITGTPTSGAGCVCTVVLEPV